MKRRFLWLAAAALAIGVAVMLYRGPGRGVIRGHAGDVAATMLVYAVLGLIWRTRPAVRAAASFAIAALIECGQTLWRGEGLAGEIVVGSTFDGWDFVAYAAGVAIAVAWDAWGGRGRDELRALSAARRRGSGTSARSRGSTGRPCTPPRPPAPDPSSRPAASA